MKIDGVQLFLVILAPTLITACASKPAVPQPAAQPGLVHFIINGTSDAISAFRVNLDKIKPGNCENLTVDEGKHEEKRDAIGLLYRCANTNAEMFLMFGRAYVQTVGGNSSSAQASVEPIYLAQNTAALSMTATTSSCISQYCSLLKSSGPWYPHYLCTKYCP